jgi:hypothetical protein
MAPVQEMKLKRKSFIFSFPQMPVEEPQQTLFFLTRGLVAFLDSALTEHWGSSKKGLLFRGSFL